MRAILLLPAAALAGWVLAPIIDAAIRGTIDDRTRAAIRSGRDGVAAPDVDLPAPRSSTENERAAARHGS